MYQGIMRVALKIVHVCENRMELQAPKDEVFATTFTNQTSSVTVHLSLEEWFRLVSLLDADRSRTTMEQSWKTIMVNWEQEPFRGEREVFHTDPKYRAGDMHYRQTGVLLPFGAKSAHFTEYNL